MPHIPKQHLKYNLLPSKRNHGGEVFSYNPDKLREAESLLKNSDVCIEPYGYESYAEYFSNVDKAINFLHGNDESVRKLIDFKNSMKEMNKKEVWSVLKYTGPATDSAFGLTVGRYYYWPCSLRYPYYEGVIDDEEYTSYLYSTDKANWEIVEDPTGMAYRTLSGWSSKLDEDELARIAADVARYIARE